jgi:hypothetical protein
MIWSFWRKKNIYPRLTLGTSVTKTGRKVGIFSKNKLMIYFLLSLLYCVSFRFPVVNVVYSKLCQLSDFHGRASAGIQRQTSGSDACPLAFRRIRPAAPPPPAARPPSARSRARLRCEPDAPPAGRSDVGSRLRQRLPMSGVASRGGQWPPRRVDRLCVRRPPAWAAARVPQSKSFKYR